jgi:hypothetical protein
MGGGGGVVGMREEGIAGNYDAGCLVTPLTPSTSELGTNLQIISIYSIRCLWAGMKYEG